MRAYERLLKYAQVMTPSDESSETVPSSRCQFTLAEQLVEELKELGVADARVDEKCYVYGSIPASCWGSVCLQRKILGLKRRR